MGKTVDPTFEKNFKWFSQRPPQEPVERPDFRDHIKGVNGKDPMSPYELPQSEVVYTSITEAMNKKAFLARFPQSYTPIAGYFRRYNITPYFDPVDVDGWSKGMVTVAGMIEMVNNGIEFQLLRDQDFDVVITIAETYNKFAMQYPDPALQSYVKKVQIFLREAEQARQRMLKRTGRYDNRVDFMSILKKILVSPS